MSSVFFLWLGELHSTIKGLHMVQILQDDSIYLDYYIQYSCLLLSQQNEYLQPSIFLLSLWFLVKTDSCERFVLDTCDFCCSKIMVTALYIDIRIIHQNFKMDLFTEFSPRSNFFHHRLNDDSVTNYKFELLDCRVSLKEMDL